MALRPVTQVAATEPGAKTAAAPVNNSRDPVCLHSVANIKPRQEFLATETYFGNKKQKIRTLAYLDTLSSHCFISEKLFKKMHDADPCRSSVQYTTESVVSQWLWTKMFILHL